MQQYVEHRIFEGPSGPSSGSRIVGRGEIAALIRERDWSGTPLGPLASWSDHLVCTVNMMLACAFPSLLFWGPEMVQLYNDAFRPLIGEKHPEGIGQGARICWDEAWDLIGPQFEAVLKRGETICQQKMLVPILRDGRVQDVWWNYSYSPIFAPDGTIAGMLAVCHDVTGELLVMRDLEASEERATRILESIAEGVIVTDVGQRITRMNKVAESLTGWTAEDACGVALAEVFRIIDEDTRAPLESLTEAAERVGGTGANHAVLIRKDGAEVPLEDSAALIRDAEGGNSGVVVVFHSVAEQRQAARALLESEERLRSIYSTTLEYIGLLSADGKIIDLNRAALEFAGNTREELIGTWFWEGPWFSETPGAPEVVRAAIGRAATGELHLNEISLTRSSGDIIPFDFSITPVFDREGKVRFLVPEARDLRELKRAQRALLESEKIATVGRLASSIAHEINNPLEAVTNLLYLARQTSSLPEVQEYLQAADHELRRVSAIANQTLRFHKQTSNAEAVEAADLFSTVLSIYEGRLRNSGVTMETRHRVKEPVLCFQGDVRQVLNNLVGNAIDAMGGGGGRLLIRSQASTEWRSGRKGVVFTVADTGCGMTRAVCERVFEPFFTTKGIGGTGLGLWVSQEVAQRHRGVLRVRSSKAAEHHGTVFRFFLPYAEKS